MGRIGSDAPNVPSESAPTSVPAAERTSGGLPRRFYEWVIGWADTKYGVWALGGVALAESSFFPVPPDPVLLSLCLGAHRRALVFATVATTASVVGGIVGYWIGAEAWQVLGGFFFEHVPGVNEASFARVQALYTQWDFGAVVFAGLTPIPYKVFALSAGVFAIDLPTFIAASIVGRGLRFFLIATLIRLFGEPVKAFIDRYFVVLAWALGLLLVAGFAVLRFL